MAKCYVVRRVGGQVSVTVSGGPEGEPYTLPHLPRHSPDGFECGDSGSGPADLARAIVADHLSHESPHPFVYQLVKDRLVAPLPQATGGVITQQEVAEVVGSVRNQGLPLFEYEHEHPVLRGGEELVGKVVLSVRRCTEGERVVLQADGFAVEFETGHLMLVPWPGLPFDVLVTTPMGRLHRLAADGART